MLDLFMNVHSDTLNIRKRNVLVRNGEGAPFRTGLRKRQKKIKYCRFQRDRNEHRPVNGAN